MSISQFDNIRVVLAEPSAKLRAELKACLRKYGFQSIQDTGNLLQVAEAVGQGNVDLLIADTSLPEGSFNDFVRELRHGKHGDNPFLVTVTLINDPSCAAVHAAIDSGTDHIMAKPFAPQDIINPVIELTHKRQRFVVTSDYIGPDRRSKPRAGIQIASIHVPNPLRQRMTGQVSDEIMRRSVEAAKAIVNEQKVVRHAFQIGWLLEHLLPKINAEERDGDYAENIERLLLVSEDISKRIRTTRYAHVSEMCMTLSNMVKSAKTHGFLPHDAMLISKMVKILESAFDPAHEELGAACQRKIKAVGKANEETSLAVA